MDNFGSVELGVDINFVKEADPDSFYQVWGALWLTDDASDDVFVLWGLERARPMPGRHIDTLSGWWSAHEPWCLVMEWQKPPSVR